MERSEILLKPEHMLVSLKQVHGFVINCWQHSAASVSLNKMYVR